MSDIVCTIFAFNSSTAGIYIRLVDAYFLVELLAQDRLEQEVD